MFLIELVDPCLKTHLKLLVSKGAFPFKMNARSRRHIIILVTQAGYA